MSQVTKPMMLDETGQAIVTALGNIGNAVQPTNVCVDLPVSIPANGWTNSAPYTYTYTHSKITAECGVTVEFESGASNTDCLAMDYEKVAGGVMFTVKTKPSSAVPVIIHVLNAEAESITSVSADMVSTSAISGSSNVEQALGALNSKVSSMGNLVSIKSNMVDGAYTVNHDFTQYRYVAFLYNSSAYYRQCIMYPVSILTGSGKCGYDNLLDSTNRCYCLKTSGASTSSVSLSVSIPSSGTWSGGYYELIGIK